MDHFNPHVDFGGTVTGTRFIGREPELRTIGGRVFGVQAFGSIALIGLPRIGKTSLISEAIRREGLKVDGQRPVVVRADVGAFDSADGLFRYVLESLLEGIRSQKLGNELLEKRVNETFAKSAIDFTSIRTIFKSLRQTGTRVVCVLDEFDAGRRVFRDAPELFHWLRELCSNPEFKAAVVLVAKRPLQEVARLAGYESNYWANVLMTLPVRPFSDDEMATFFSNLENECILLDEAERSEVLALAGGHPYLLDAFAYYAWEHVKQGGDISVDWIRAIFAKKVREYHQQVSTILEDGPMLSKVIQVLLGPQWDITEEDVDTLRDLGVLHDDNGTLRGFTASFEAYLRILERNFDLWPLWRDTERVLRDVLERRLESTYGSAWPNVVGKSHPKLKPVIEACQEKRSREQNSFGSRNSESSLLAYGYPMDLYRLMGINWSSLGEPLLGKDRQSWAMKFSVLSKVRTPLAHNRVESVGDGERKQAEGICHEILNRFREFEDAPRELSN